MQEKIYDQREATYGTQGLDNYTAKDQAAKRAAMANATGAGLLGSDRLPTATEEITRELEEICDILRETGNMQEAQYLRLFGPRPEEARNGAAALSSEGHLHVISERLKWVREFALRARTNQQFLEQVG